MHVWCVQADKYTYEMCLFGSAAQKDAHLHTGLGQWDGFKNGHSLASFTNGQHCWQGPPRSLQASPFKLQMLSNTPYLCLFSLGQDQARVVLVHNWMIGDALTIKKLSAGIAASHS